MIGRSVAVAVLPFAALSAFVSLAAWLDFYGGRGARLFALPERGDSISGTLTKLDGGISFVDVPAERVLAVIVPGCWLTRGRGDQEGQRVLSSAFLARLQTAGSVLSRLNVDRSEALETPLVPLALTGAGKEAQLAAEFAHDSLGVSWEHMAAEHSSTVTLENAQLIVPEVARYWAVLEEGTRSGSAADAPEMNLTARDTVVVVSDSYHLLRCGFFFGEEFGRGWPLVGELLFDSTDGTALPPVRVVTIPSFSPFPSRVYGALREVGGVVKNVLFGDIPLRFVLNAALRDLRGVDS
jgi:DUF218 domain